MATILRNNYVFGPIFSRRLGRSLGINLLPISSKICNYNCVYCECGWNDDEIGNRFPMRELIKEQLYAKLQEMQQNSEDFDVITFSGNGEPTLHPSFAEIIDDTIEIRDIFYPKNQICVLSNATNLNDDKVFNALKKIEKPILKIDSANPETFWKINMPAISVNYQSILAGMLRFNGDFIMQIMFLRGENNGIKFDNTTPEEVQGLLDIIQKSKPRQVMIYTIDRETPAKNLEKLSAEKLQAIGQKIEKAGVDIFVTI